MPKKNVCLQETRRNMMSPVEEGCIAVQLESECVWLKKHHSLSRLLFKWRYLNTDQRSSAMDPEQCQVGHRK